MGGALLNKMLFMQWIYCFNDLNKYLKISQFVSQSILVDRIRRQERPLGSPSSSSPRPKDWRVDLSEQTVAHQPLPLVPHPSEARSREPSWS